ncbi:MAG: hypothetical protein NC206_09565 [Bacteroides sp.]|nr:hypothetical protein [Roseburia sp.]MCM1347316.1 hypothetical protein [Bacteroides sp.]MCM1421797.1 hypothetical protein [Bacteroides sp.]
MNKLVLFAASLTVSMTSFAQWTKPADPASIPLTVGKECYLFNKDAGAFFVGANDYGTRASVSVTSGHKVILVQSETDANSYLVTNAAESSTNFLPLYIKQDGIWVDESGSNTGDDLFCFELQNDGTYRFGFSSLNSEWTPSTYPGAYLGVIPSRNDTRLYVCDPEEVDDYSMSDCHIAWCFVEPESYKAYTADMKQYGAAVVLGERIAEAESLAGVDADVLSAAKAMYDNTESTAEAMELQAKTLETAIRNARLSVATVGAPVEALSLLGIATDFNDGTCPGWTSTTGASNKQASNGNNAADFSVTGNHYENWNWDAFSVGKISASATEMPTGVYHLNALAFANVSGGTYLYAGETQKLVEADKIDIDKPMDLYTIVVDGNLEIGLDVQVRGANWVGLDNVYLYYIGNTAEAYNLLVSEALNAEPDYESMLAEEQIHCQTSVYETYKSAKSALVNASVAEDVAKSLSAFYVASKAMKESVSVYGKYSAKVDEANEWVGTTTSVSDEVFLLSDYLMMEDADETDFNGNGGAINVLKSGLLDADQIAAELAYLEKLLTDAKANAKADGDDCTDLIKNPRFAEAGGWQGVTNASVTWPVGDTSIYPVMQAHNVACDIYQELTGLQNGLYEFKLQAAFRPGDVYTDEYESIATAYAYINSFETKIPTGNLGETAINEPEDASKAFSEDLCPVVVYGLVTDGTMKLGVTNKVRTVENCRLWAGGATLTFRGKNEEVLAQVISQTLPLAQALLENYAGKPELDILAEAVAAAQNAEDAYHALVDLKKAMENVEEGTLLYANLAVALKTLSEAIENNTTANQVTINNAKAVLEAAQDAYDNHAYSNEAAQQAISDLNAASVSVKMGGDKATEDNPVDYSSMIVNNNFDPARGDKNTSTIEGWTTTTLNGYKENTASYNKNTFALSQTLTGLPKGKYKVTVHAFYRAGSYEEEANNINNGVDTHLAVLYAETSAETFKKPVMNLSEGGVASADEVPGGVKTQIINGVYVPDGTSPSVAFYNAGYYLNELEFTVGEDGVSTIGMRLDKTIGSNDYVVIGEWKLWYMGDASEGQTEQKVSELIVNNNFDPARGDKSTTTIEGWTTTTMNGYKENTASYNKNTFALSQKLSGLPEGTYKVTVHAYYRAGSYEEEANNINNGVDTHLTILYAQTSEDKYSKPVMNLSEGGVASADEVPNGVKTQTINGIYVPDGTSPSVAFYNAGYYLNELPFYVGNDGVATIGMYLDRTIGSNDYVVVGEWNLYYYGSGKNNDILGGDVDAVETPAAVSELAVPVAYYSVSGAKLVVPQKGINIVKMSDGTVRKILVK